MRSLIFFAVSILFSTMVTGSVSWGLSGAQCTKNDPLSIEKAITTTLAENPDITMTVYLVKMAETNLKKTRALFMPAISLYTEFTAGDAPSAYLFKIIDQRDLPQRTNFNDPGSFSNLETGITMGWNIYNGGKDYLLRDIAGSEISKKNAMLGTIKNNIVLSVIKLYFSILKAEDYLLIAEESRDTVKEQLRIMEVRFKGGGVLKSDILSLRARLAESEKNLVQSENIYSTTITALTTLMGQEPLETINLIKDCTCPVSFPDTYHQGIKIAMKKRPELKIAAKRIEKAQMAVKMAGAGYLPRVDINSRYYMDSDNTEFNSNNDNYTVGVIAKWDVFTGFSTEAELAGAGYNLIRARTAMKKTELAIFKEVKTAFLSFTDASKRFEVAKTATAQAEESFALARERYQGGSVPITRYLETELAKKQAEINLVSARYDKKIAQGEIARALGILSTIWEKG